MDFFGWMGRVASNQDKDHYFDKFALPRAEEGFAGNLRLLALESRECRRTNPTEATLC